MTKHKRLRTVALAASALALGVAILWFVWPREAIPADLPDAADVASMEVSLWGSNIGLPELDLTAGRISPQHFDTILACLRPAEPSTDAGEMMRLPQLGEIRIREKGGRTRRVSFVDAGKNPLCFAVDGVAFIRGGRDYPNYLEDHVQLYDLASERVAEPHCFARKLDELCRGAGR